MSDLIPLIKSELFDKMSHKSLDEIKNIAILNQCWNLANFIKESIEYRKTIEKIERNAK